MNAETAALAAKLIGCRPFDRTRLHLSVRRQAPSCSSMLAAPGPRMPASLARWHASTWQCSPFELSLNRGLGLQKALHSADEALLMSVLFDVLCACGMCCMQDRAAPGVANTSSLHGQCVTTRNLLIDLELLSQADYFVGTQKSGLSAIIEVAGTAERPACAINMGQAPCH